MEFSKKIICLQSLITGILVVSTILLNALTEHDVTAIATLCAASFAVDGTWGGFYLWKSKNENRAKYAQKFITEFADKYGFDAACRIAEIVLKD